MLKKSFDTDTSYAMHKFGQIIHNTTYKTLVHKLTNY